MSTYVSIGVGPVRFVKRIQRGRKRERSVFWRWLGWTLLVAVLIPLPFWTAPIIVTATYWVVSSIKEATR